MSLKLFIHQKSTIKILEKIIKRTDFELIILHLVNFRY